MIISNCKTQSIEQYAQNDTFVRMQVIVYVSFLEEKETKHNTVMIDTKT